MNKFHDVQYLELMREVLYNGTVKGDRTGTGTSSVFGREMRFDLSEGSIPLLTTKKMFIPAIVHEVIWYLSGDSNIKYLQDNGVRIWNEWADENGDLGPVYGYQWRNWPRVIGSHVNYQTDPPQSIVDYDYIDQIADVIETIKNNPNDRRMIVSAWNVGQLPEMKLPPCHYNFQFYTEPYSVENREERFRKLYPTVPLNSSGGYINSTAQMDEYNIPKGLLTCKLTQRSCDVFLGVPFNIAQYSILTHMIAQVTGYDAKEFIWSGGDTHIYNNHTEQCGTQLRREHEMYPSPTLKLNKDIKDIDDFKFEDFEIVDYKCHDTIKAKVSV